MKKQTPITDFIKAYIEEIRTERNAVPCFNRKWDQCADQIFALSRVLGFAEATEQNWEPEQMLAFLRKEPNAENI